MELFKTFWGMFSGVVITGFVYKLIMAFFKGQVLKIVTVILAGVLLWTFASFPTESLGMFSGVAKKLMTWFVEQFKI